MKKLHEYRITLKWTGNLGTGTSSYLSYSRDHEIHVKGKPIIHGSSDPSFRGDPKRHNPEELFVSTLSSCHMLWYLHFCASHKIKVVGYEDFPVGLMREEDKGMGYFVRVTLHPKVTIVENQKVELARELHHKANQYCFIANSVNFEVKHEPDILVLNQTI